MTQILGISGSLRSQSSNSKLLIALAPCFGPKVSYEIMPTIGNLPFFSPDFEGKFPEAVVRFRQAIAKADAVVISTPEYAHGIPGLLKNALDWLVSDPLFPGKRLGLLLGSASAGTFARDACLEVLKTMSAQIVADAVISFPAIRTLFNAKGDLTSAEALIELKKAAAALAQV